MGVIRYKIWHDLWENKGRTFRVVMIIAIGAFAVGTVFGGEGLILGWLSWLVAIPLSIPAAQLIINTLSVLINKVVPF